MTVYGYLRVSTDKQDCDNQKIGVEAFNGLFFEFYDFYRGEEERKQMILL